MHIENTLKQDVRLDGRAWRRKRILTAVVASLSLAGLSIAAYFGASGADYSVSADRIRTAAVTRGNLVRDVAVTGAVVAANAPILYSNNSGIVELLANPGDPVERGQLLARVRSPELQNRLAQETASLQSADIERQRKKLEHRQQQLTVKQQLDIAGVDRDAAEREHRRAEISYQKNIISLLDFEKARDDLTKAQVALEHLQEAAGLDEETAAFELQTLAYGIERQRLVVAELERQIQALEIQAPVAGIMGNWLVEQRAQVAANTPLLSVVDLTAYEAELAIPENYADELGIGMQVEIEVAGEKLTGKLSAISPEVKDREVIARVRFDAAQQAKLRQNQRLSARILLENREDVLMVKNGPFFQSGSGRIAYRLDGHLANRVTIETGATSTSHVEILKGLEEGDMLIISSIDLFEDAQQVYVR